VRVLLIALIAGAASFGGSAPVSAQGFGHGPPAVPPGQANKGTTPGSGASGNSGSTRPGSSGTPAAPVPGVFQAATSNRQQTFGTWLDNAAVNAPGEAWVSLATTYWRSSSLREIDAPSMGASVGIASHGQFGISVPYYHVTDQAGTTFHGLGATYLTGKFAVSEDRRVKVAVSPTLEVLSWTAADVGVHRVNVVLPLSVQTDAGAARLYGSTGYFSRGSVFGAGAAEWSAGPRATLVASLSHSYSVKADPVSDALGISRHRTDASGGVYVNAGPAVVLFASAGRTLSPVTDTSGRLSLTGGVTINVAGPAEHAPRVP